MTGKRASLIWLALFSAGAGVFAGMWVVPHLQREARHSETIDRLEAERVRLVARVQGLQAELDRLRAEAGGQRDRDTEREVASLEAQTKVQTARSLQYVRMLSETQEKLAQATATIEELQDKLAELESSLAELSEENRQFKTLQEDLEDRLARANRVVEAMQIQLKESSDRMVRLEVRNRALRQEQQQAGEKLKRSQRLLAELENLNRRREDLLTTIVRRYREVAEVYRTVSMPQGTTEELGPTAGVDLSRIQNALSLAEEDLRQLRTLNARAEHVQSELER